MKKLLPLILLSNLILPISCRYGKYVNASTNTTIGIEKDTIKELANEMLYVAFRQTMVSLDLGSSLSPNPETYDYRKSFNLFYRGDVCKYTDINIDSDTLYFWDMEAHQGTWSGYFWHKQDTLRWVNGDTEWEDGWHRITNAEFSERKSRLLAVKLICDWDSATMHWLDSVSRPVVVRWKDGVCCHVVNRVIFKDKKCSSTCILFREWTEEASEKILKSVELDSSKK